MEGLHTVGCGLVPQGDHLRQWHLYPSAMQPSARCLPLGRPEPRQSACVVATPNRVYPPQMLPPPT